jgi:hypothetical protein
MMYDGSDLREILRGHELLTHPFAISVFANYIYWTDWRTNSVVRVSCEGFAIITIHLIYQLRCFDSRAVSVLLTNMCAHRQTSGMATM